MKKLITLATLAVLSGAALAEVKVADAYARAVVPGQMNSAAFMVLHNDAAQPLALVAGSSSAAQSVELHNHMHEAGVMKMRRVAQIEIPAGGEAILQPGGLHVMLLGLKRDLNVGDNIDLQLQFSDGSGQTLTVPVKAVMPMAGMQHKH